LKNPWIIPSYRVTVAGTPAARRSSAYSSPSSRRGSNSAVSTYAGGSPERSGAALGIAHDVFTSERVLAAQTEGPHPLEFAIGLMHKDVRLATRLGADSAAPMFVATAVRELHQAAIAHIGPEADVTELMRTVERNADVRVLP